MRATADAVRAGRLSATDAVAEALRRIAERPDLGAVVALRGEAALAEARAMDRAMAAGDLVPGPLAGVPVLVKDNEDVAGMPTLHGSRLFADAQPAVADDPVPARLRAAGGIVVGKTALPEFAIQGFTSSSLHGVTRNPWQPSRSPGGSSGGSAAALAAGMVGVATATDGGGSVRIPAAFCGLLGMKPTHGLVGRWPPPDWLDLSTPGVLAVDAGDLRILLSVLAGVVHGDPASAAAHPGVLGSGRPVTRLFAAERTSPLGPLGPGVAGRLRGGVAALADVLAVPVTWLDPAEVFADLGDPDADWFVLATAEHVASLAGRLGGRETVATTVAGDLLDSASREFLRIGLAVGIDDYLAARRRRPLYTRRLDDLLADGAVLVTPTVAVDAWPADGRLSGDPGPALLPADVYATAVQNITGHPAISLPWGTDAAGVPSGLQVTAPRWADGVLLDIADRWQDAHPWPRWAEGHGAPDQPHRSAIGLA